MNIQTVGGRAVAGDMIISSNASIVQGRQGYRKIAQHELGHFHGMDHANAPVGSTVMRVPIGDDGRYLPNEPTHCDANKAYERGL